MTNKTIFYSVANHGDGSAYPHFFEDSECADIHQDLQDEGWGESCTGFVNIYCDSESPIIVDEVTTKENYIAELQRQLEYEVKYKPDCLTHSTSKGMRLANAIDKLKGN
jgi:hypothetical protein